MNDMFILLVYKYIYIRGKYLKCVYIVDFLLFIMNTSTTPLLCVQHHCYIVYMYVGNV